MKLIVNNLQRYAKMRAHTGIHLLYGVMEKQLNINNIKQAGSYIDEDYGRLDFNINNALTKKQIQEIEKNVNQIIYKSIDINNFETSIDDAMKKGAKAIFNEKYGEKVRVVEIPSIDIQLCGGTHIKNTALIGAFKIIGQESVSSGIRRIIIITGPKVSMFAQEKENYIDEIAEKINTSPVQIIQKVEKLEKELSTYKSEIENLKNAIILNKLSKLEKQNGQFNYIIKQENFSGIDFKTLVKKTKENLKGKILIYSKTGSFAIISDGTFSAKIFSNEKGLKGGGNDNIVQGKDKNILELVISSPDLK